MKLYLMRHGHAEEKFTDSKRPLSEFGRMEVTGAADLAVKTYGIEAETVYHSSKLRAGQTAEILAEAMRIKPRVMEGEELTPLDDPEYWRRRVQKEEGSIALVGHMPFMADLCMLLLRGSGDQRIVRFYTAQIVCLSRDEGGDWKWEWVVTP